MSDQRDFLTKRALSWLISGVGLAIAVVALFFVDPSSEVVTQWGSDGRPKNTGPAWIAFLMIPVISALMLGIVSALRHIDPRRENIKKSRTPIDAIILATIGLMFLIEIAVIAEALGYSIIGPRGIMVAVGLMLAIVANYLPKTKSNWFFGIRTPWTLSSDEIWHKTHRLGSRTIMAGGLITAAIGVFVPITYLHFVIMAVILPSTLIPVIYSWYLWHQGGGNNID